MRLLLIAMLCSLVVCATAKPKKKAKPKEDFYIISWVHCAPCKALEALVKENGATVTKSHTAIRPVVSFFPTCHRWNAREKQYVQVDEQYVREKACRGSIVRVLEWSGQ